MVGSSHPGHKPTWTVIGGGNGGQALAGHLALMGFPVRLYDIVPETIDVIRGQQGIQVDGAVKGFGRIEFATTDLHIANFASAVRGEAAPSAPIDEGHKSVLLCQLANIAWHTGHVLHTDKRNGRILGDPEAMALWGREYEPGWEPKV